jgi:hypothetical protein
MKKKKNPILVYGNYYHVSTSNLYLGVAECRLVDGKERFIQKAIGKNGLNEEIECSFIAHWELATDEEIKEQEINLI